MVEETQQKNSETNFRRTLRIISGNRHPSRGRSASENTLFKKFDELFINLGHLEVFTCLFAGVAQFAYSWNKLIHPLVEIFFDFECISNTTWKCDPNCEEIIFPAAGKKTNIVTEWKLVCDKEYKLDIPDSCFLGALMFGFLLFGHVSDQHGRRNCIIGSCFTVLITGCLAAITPWFWLFCLAQVLSGFSLAGWTLCGLVFVVEYVAEKHREFVIVMLQISFYMALSTLPAIQAIVDKWRTLQLIVSGVGFVGILYFWMLPESPRWLLLTGRIEECASVLRTRSRNKNISLEYMENIIRITYTDLRAGNYPQMSSYSDLFKTKDMCKKTLIVTIVWFAIVFLLTSTLELHPKIIPELIFIIFRGCLFIMGTILSYPIVKFVSRRMVNNSMFSVITICLFMKHPIAYFCGIEYTLIIDIILPIPVSVLSVNIFLIATETYPTYLRNSGMGLGFCVSQVGIICLRFWWKESPISSVIKLIIMISLSFLSMILILYIPETKGANLPHIIADSENISRHNTSIGSSLSQKSQV